MSSGSGSEGEGVENVCPQAWGGGDGGGGGGGTGEGGRGGRLARELRRLHARPPPGVRLLASDKMDTVTALIEGPAETPYCGGVFRVSLSLPARYPHEAPRCVFHTRVFHPNVCALGRVCVDTLARGWRPGLGLAHALAAVRCLLIAPNADSALNADAAALLRDDYRQYAARARLYTDIHARPPSAPTAPPAPKPADAHLQQMSEEPSSAASGTSGPASSTSGPASSTSGPASSTSGPASSTSGPASSTSGPAAKRERRTGPRAGPRDTRRILKRL